MEVPNDEPDEIKGRSFDCSGRRHKRVSTGGVQTMAGTRPGAEASLAPRRAGKFRGGDETGYRAQARPSGSVGRRHQAMSGCAVRRVDIACVTRSGCHLSAARTTALRRVHLLSSSRVRIASCDPAFERAMQAWDWWRAPVVTSGDDPTCVPTSPSGVLMTWCRPLARQDAHARVQGRTGRRNIAFRGPPVLRGIP